MEASDLDRVVSKTELSPLTKIFLRRVRRAIAAGDVEGFRMNKSSWSIRVMDRTGFSCTYVFNLRKANGDDKTTNH